VLFSSKVDVLKVKVVLSNWRPVELYKETEQEFMSPTDFTEKRLKIKA
jgi:hypothetical protein